MKCPAVRTPAARARRTARRESAVVIRFPEAARMSSSPDSRPKLIIHRPAFFISARVSPSMVSTRLLQVQVIRRPASRIPAQKLRTYFRSAVKVSAQMKNSVTPKRRILSLISPMTFATGRLRSFRP